MKWLRNAIWRWLGGTSVQVAVPKEASSNMLNMVTHPDATGAINVVPISNGFLLCSRKFNPNGPDAITARYVESADKLGDELTAIMAVTRITK